MNRNEELLSFIERSPVSFQAVENLSGMLENEGFERLEERNRWRINCGGNYYVTRNDSALIAFSVPDCWEGIRIAASHSDSPCFKLKENPEIARTGRYTVLNVEKYGGMLMNPWFDRPLGIAGRVFIHREDGHAERVLVSPQRDLCMIPSLAIHMDRTANDGRKLNAQEDMLPLSGLREEGGGSLMDVIAREAGCVKEDILGSDLFVYNRQKGCIWGPGNEFISAPRLDDLQCAYSTLCGFLEAERKRFLSVYAVFDSEEVGSSTRQGAASTFLADTLRRIYLALGRDFEQYQIDLAHGMMISADNAHAVHPNYESKSDPVNRPVIGGGVVLKFSGNQKYCTDGCSAAAFRGICRDAGVNVQVFTNRADLPGGSTLGNISNNQVAIASVDIGLAQLAMHSPFETAGTSDTEDMVRVAKEFFS